MFQADQYKAWAYCSLCQTEVYCTDTMSTGIPVRHLCKEHRDQYNHAMETEMKKKKKIESESTKHPKISKFVTSFPTFEKAFVNWMVQTYQPLSACEKAAF